MASKLQEKTKRNFYVAMLIFLSCTLICLFTNFLSFYKQFLVGSFGLVIYPAIILGLCIFAIKLTNKSFKLDRKSILYCVLIFVCFLAILHMALTRSFDFSSFSNYITQVYNSSLTAGGVTISLIVFPLRFLLHEIATYIILSIALVILVACAIDNYYTKMAKISKAKKTFSANTLLKDIENIKDKEQNKAQTALDSRNAFSDDIEQYDANLNEQTNVKNRNQNASVQDEQEEDKKQKYVSAKDILGISNNCVSGSASNNAYEVLFGDEASKKKAFSTLYPEKQNSLYQSTSAEEYLQDGLEKYMPEQFKKPKYVSFRQDDLAISKAKNDMRNEKLKQSSIEYLNRTIPKNAQSGTIIRGDYYGETDDSSIEVVGQENSDVFSFDNDYGQSYNDMGSMYSNEMYQEHTQEELELEKILHDTHTFTPSDYEESGSAMPFNMHEVQDVTNPFEDRNAIFNSFQDKHDSSNLGASNLTTSEHSSESGDHLSSYVNSQEDKIDRTHKEQVKKKKKKKYVKPPVSLLTVDSSDMSEIQADTVSKSNILEQTLSSFKIPAKVHQVVVGPAVTMYELTMPAGVSVKGIFRYSRDLALALASKKDVRILAPIPGKNAVGIEVPNEKGAVVGFREVFEKGDFAKNANKPLSFVLGKDIYGNYQFCDLAKAPHILIAGSTGSGKSVCLNILLISLIYKSSPQDVRLILVDPKRVEFAIYEGLPHLMLPSIITEPERAVNAFTWAVNEMEKRYRILQQLKVRDIGEYNNLEEVKNGIREKMPFIVMVVDELADLMAVAKRDLEDKIQRIAAKARSAGIHLVLATQRPSIDVVTGTIKNNLPVRIAFSLASFSDSKTVIDQSGAENLLGKGDMLYSSNGAEPQRFQSALITTEEIKNIVEFVKQNNDADYEDNIEAIMLENQENHMEQASKPVVAPKNVAETDELFVYALKIVVETRQASASLLQRRLRLGWNRAGSLIDAMQQMGYISAPENNKRQVLISMEQFTEIYGEVEDL